MQAPPYGSAERWCWDFILECEQERKLRPQALPEPLVFEPCAPARRLVAPGRPAAWQHVGRSPRTPKASALAAPAARIRLLHTFIHHELQAAELFAWALLAFPSTPEDFRTGLLRLAQEELGHLELYRAHLGVLGGDLAQHGARDWFWERALGCQDPSSFLAFQGLGLEGANLDHSARFAQGFRSAGDEAGARLLERVGTDEEQHVAFSMRWFKHFEGSWSYARWKAALPVPLTPALFKGNPIQREARMRAGMDAAMLDALQREPPARGKR